MMAGPDDPRDSRLRTTPPLAAKGSELTNASAPHRHASSASVKTSTTSLRRAGPAFSARAVSSRPATPAPSSLAPYETWTES